MLTVGAGTYTQPSPLLNKFSVAFIPPPPLESFLATPLRNTETIERSCVADDGELNLIRPGLNGQF